MLRVEKVLKNVSGRVVSCELSRENMVHAETKRTLVYLKCNQLESLDQMEKALGKSFETVWS